MNTWKQLIDLYEGRFRSRSGEQLWVFRGQASSRWRLQTYLERLFSRYSPTESPYDLEKWLIREFQRKAHHYMVHLPRLVDTLEWLSLMRHHGAPTRLLDWTYSFFVAAYFACEGADEECAIWVLDSTWCRQRAKGELEGAGLLQPSDQVEPDPLHVDGSLKRARRFRRMMMQKPGVQLVYPVNPFRLNERITIQQGVFMCPGDVSVEFERNLAALGDTSASLFKILIDQSAVPGCLKELHRMNMSRATLYPGLDGFAWSLSTRLAFPETLRYRL